MTAARQIRPLVFIAIGLAAQLIGYSTSCASIALDPSFFPGGTYSDSRSTSAGGGLLWGAPGAPNFGNWANGAFSIAWTITDNGPDYTYKYTITTPDNARLSHWILELSDVNAMGKSLTAYWEDLFSSPPTPGNYTDQGIADVPVGDVGPDADDGNSNVGIPSSIYGVKFTKNEELSQTWVQFTTPQVPVWGDFYARDGKNPVVHAFNAGFGTDPTGDNYTNWIPRPDGTSKNLLPEASSFMIWTLIISCSCMWRSQRI